MSHRCLILNFALNQQKKFLKLYLPIFFNIGYLLFAKNCFLFVVSLFNFQRTVLHHTHLLGQYDDFYLGVLPLVELVGTNGLEPSTSRLSGVRSNHLSYAPLWWRLRESNP